MQNTNTQIQKQVTAGQLVKNYLDREGGAFKKRFEEVLGKNAAAFVASMVNVANTLPADTDPKSIMASAFVAATLKLPIDRNLGFAWIIPYRKNGVNVAQFQMGYKGYIQLGLRSGQFAAMNDFRVNKDAFESFNPITGELKIDVAKLDEDAEEIVGYGFYFKLSNGFEKTTYWPTDKVIGHAKRFSKNFSQASGPWKSDFDAMASKVVIKSALAKYGILSIEMERAMKMDQAVATSMDVDATPEYVDTPSKDAIYEMQPPPEFNDDDQIPGAEFNTTPQNKTGYPMESPQVQTEIANPAKHAPTIVELAVSPQDRLQCIVESHGMKLEVFSKWANAGGHLKDEVTAWSNIPDKLALLCIKASTGMISGMERFK